MALLQPPSNTIHIANTYIAGFVIMMAHWSHYVINPAGQNTIPKRIQIAVKFVPSTCLTGEAKGKRFYQYTAIDEFSRWRSVEGL